MDIEKVEISADGRTAAFKQFNRKEFIFMHEWIVYDLDKNEEISFAQNDQGEDVKTDFDSVQFCPAQSQTHVIMTLSGDLCEVRIWKIEGNCIRPTNKQISRQYDIEYCRWVLVQDSVCVLLWWRKYRQREEYKNYAPYDPEKWINECQIEMWDAQQWTCRSFKVPAFIHAKDDDRYFATNDFQNGLHLTRISIYRDAAYMTVQFHVVGSLLLLLENGDHIAILDQDLHMKRYKDNIKYFDNFATQFFNHENLWSDKQLINYENRSSLNIYNPQTLQLQITLPFPHFRIWDMQWNLQHSQLIIRSRKDYCLVTHVKKT
ncbi:hypothetical protein TrispH2_011851 [Trichoplax sp. H2]|nr:hypothetical protein TrispH2_011851 [Trichoplax sp. H2]|eukprot:RDD35768.1 hypothetical protein TrispH2_011851 [Trichoplax sp. H2]